MQNINPRQAMIQSPNCNDNNPAVICSFDIEMDTMPTSPILHQQSRLLYVIEGEGCINIQGVDYLLNKGTLVSLLPWQYSIITKVEEPLRYYKIIYNFDLMNRIIKGLFNSTNNPISIINPLTYVSSVHVDPSLQSQVEHICQLVKDELGIESLDMETIKRDEVSDIYVNALIVELIVLYVRSIDQEINYPYDYSVDNSDEFTPPKEVEIFQYIYRNLNAKPALQDLADHFYMSQSSISKHIKDLSGLSYSDLVVNMRFVKSMNLLLHTTLKLDELTELIGFFDASHFSHIFNKKAGMTANNYRDQYSQIKGICKTNDDQIGYQIVTYMNYNYGEEISLESVAEHFNLTPSRVNNILLYHVEETFHDFLNLLRVNKASQLLLETDMNISSIAFEVGYNYTKTFSRNFNKIFKMSPGRFRKLNAIAK